MSAPAVGPLEFWRQNADQLLLCVSASSAQSERDFSSVGRTVTEMRSRLSADKVEALELVRSGMRLGVV